MLLKNGDRISSPGGSYTYEIVSLVCPLYDRAQMPWPCCSLEWHGKSPSWRRVGKQLVPDVATKGHPSYVVKIVGVKNSTPSIVTLYYVKLTEDLENWWRSKTPYLRILQGQEETVKAA